MLTRNSTLLKIACTSLGLACTTEDIDPKADTVTELRANVTVDFSGPGTVVPPIGFGMHASVYDNNLMDGDLPELLHAAGIRALRYPGGGYSDNYHWWNHTMTPWIASGDTGYLGPNTDFGSFVSVLKSFDGEAVITVNYGSNLAGTGPGEPEEAAAWVAYANGDPENSLPLGVDSSGKDWHSVGYWASLRAASPLSSDDGLNFLRIGEPEPLGIEYWEIGNELFGNGYYGTNYEQDLHVPYTPGDFDYEGRENHEELSPRRYGQGVVTFLDAMKAVDPAIKVGAVLVTPPMDYSWAPTWNQDVLAACGNKIDFAIVHWYPARSDTQLVQAPTRDVPRMAAELESSLAEYRGERPVEIEVLVTEMGPAPGYDGNATIDQAVGIFAADGYASLLRHGVTNIDWLELHNGTFLAERSDRLGPAYKGIQMAHQLAAPGDTLLLQVSTDSNTVPAHASRRTDGSYGIMLVNTSHRLDAHVTLSIAGATWSSGVRHDFTPAADGTSSGEITGPIELSPLAGELSLEVPAYGVTNLILSP